MRVRPYEYNERMTSREREVAVLIAEGLARKQIALRLGIAHPTVDHHCAAVFAKTGYSDRALLAVAVATGRLRL